MDKMYFESNQKGYLGAYSEVFISSSNQLAEFPTVCGTPIRFGGASPYDLQLLARRKIKTEKEIGMIL